MPLGAHPSAKADIASSQPRIHSPWAAEYNRRVRSGEEFGRRGAEEECRRPASSRERVNSPQRLRKASQTARGFNGTPPHAARRTPVGEGRHRVVPAANSFARAAGRTRVSPPALSRERVNSPQRLRKASQTARGFNGTPPHAARHTPVGEGRHRVSQPRIHSPGRRAARRRASSRSSSRRMASLSCWAASISTSRALS